MNRRLTYTFAPTGSKKPVGLAINCHMFNGRLRFYDTIRGHEIEGRIVQDGEDAFEYESAGHAPGVWKFKALTIEEFRRETCKIVTYGPIIAKAITNTPDLHEWFRAQFGEDAGLLYPDVLEE